jgi:hypothetical protein
MTAPPRPITTIAVQQVDKLMGYHGRQERRTHKKNQLGVIRFYLTVIVLVSVVTFV